jgi:hypothetical protein
MLDLGGAAAIVLASPGGAARSTEQHLRLPASHNHQHDPADHTKSAQDRREIDPVSFLVLDFNGTELRVFFFGVPTQSTVGKPDDANDD